MAQWMPFPYPGQYQFDTAKLTTHWADLHAGDAEPLPQDPRVLQAWVLLHNGEFEAAAQAGLAAGAAGATVVHKATAIYANYLEPQASNRQNFFMQVVASAQAQTSLEPENANAWYWYAYALGRYSQGISVAKALAQGLGTKIKVALHRSMELAPQHADARMVLGSFHAEVIDKVGPLVGGMTYGVKKETALKLLQEALALYPTSVAARMEYANALIMLEGDSGTAHANALYEQAANSQARDAIEHLDVALARAELQVSL